MDISPVSRCLKNFLNMHCQRQDGLTGFFMRTCKGPLLALPFSSTLIQRFGYRDYTRAVVLLGATALSIAAYALYKLLKKAEKPKVVAFEVYISGQTGSGPIGEDKRYNFSQRLQNSDGSAFVVKTEDFYVELEAAGKRSIGEIICPSNKQKMPRKECYLPASLFVGKKDGDKIRFIWDGQEVELTLSQPLRPFYQESNVTFENVLADAGWGAQYRRNPVAERDAKYPLFFGKELGHQVTHSSFDPKANILSYYFYREDSKNFTTYAVFNPTVTKLEDAAVCYTFDLCHIGGVPFSGSSHLHVNNSDIHLMRSHGYNGVDELWVLIPHKDEKKNNQWPEGGCRISGINDEEFGIGGRTFRPNSSDHLRWYRHGRYGRVEIPKGSEYTVERVTAQAGNLHLLRITVSPQAK